MDTSAAPAAGLIGFDCPRTSTPVLFDHCFRDCEELCLPLPLLMSLGSHRTPKPGIYHVTEITNPPQIVVLQRQHAYHAAPLDQVWLTFGTAWHSVIERQRKRIEELGKADRWIIEKSFEREFKTPAGTAVLRGTPDLYDARDQVLWDFKTVKQYFVEKCRRFPHELEDSPYTWQLNIYKAYTCPDAKKLKLMCLMKDWSRWVYISRGKGKPRLRRPNPLASGIQVIEVPQMIQGYIEGFVASRLEYLLRCADDPSLVRPCSESERWVNERTGEPTRCMNYCPVSDVCPQNRRHEGIDDSQDGEPAPSHEATGAAL